MGHIPAGMLAEQLGNLEVAERHYEQHLALVSTQQAPETQSSGLAAAYASVMKVSSWHLIDLQVVDT